MSCPVDVSEDRLVEYVLGELRRDEAQALEGLMQADTQLAAEVRRLRQVFELMPYATLAEPPVDLRARILDAAVARAQPVAKDAAARRRAPRAVSSGAASWRRRPPCSRSRSDSTRGARARSWRCSAR